MQPLHPLRAPIIYEFWDIVRKTCTTQANSLHNLRMFEVFKLILNASLCEYMSRDV